MRRFAELAARASDVGVRFGFAVSPGLDITYESEADRAVLVDKLLALVDHGVTWFLLLLDDIPMQPGLAPRQADLACGVLGALRGPRYRRSTLTVCPTEYVGMQLLAVPGRARCGAAGRRRRHVDRARPCAHRRSRPPTRGRAPRRSADGRRSIWDNYPVNDGTMSCRAARGPVPRPRSGARRCHRRRPVQPDEPADGVEDRARDGRRVLGAPRPNTTPTRAVAAAVAATDADPRRTVDGARRRVRRLRRCRSRPSSQLAAPRGPASRTRSADPGWTGPVRTTADALRAARDLASAVSCRRQQR